MSNFNVCVKPLILATLCLQMVCLIESIRVDVKPHPDDLRSREEAQSQMEVEVATPLRLIDGNRQIASSDHFRSRLSLTAQSNGSEFTNPVYKLHAFGEDLLLRLKLDDDLLAPGYTTTLSPENAFQNKTDFYDSLSLRGCFYKGEIIGRRNSIVGVSLCDSMTGSFATDEYHYFIEPLEKTSLNGSSILHSIRRRSIATRDKRHVSGESTHCGVNEERHRTTYRRTFKRRAFQEMALKVR